MKRRLLLIIIILCFLFVNKLDALEGYTTASSVNVRTGPGINYETITPLSSHESLDIVSNELYNIGDSNCSSGWYKINYDNSERYICSLWVSIGENQGSQTAINTDTYEARISEVGVTVRTGASYSYSGKTLLPGTNVVIVGNKIYTAGSSCTDGWYYIKYNGNNSGYTCSTYVKKKSEITASDEEYEKYLISIGFPESYTPYLVYLHQKHPSWKFNPIDTGLYWDNVISGESYKNYLQYYDLTYVTDFTVREVGSGSVDWYTAKDSTNAFYLDPRNLLTENFIFAFETLAYNYADESKEEFNKDSVMAKLYYDALVNLFKNSYLKAEEYVLMYLGAGFKYNVNPLHLASRTIQEGGSNENYGAITGNYTELYGSDSVVGFYNYYSVGAYADNVTSNPLLRGLAYAATIVGGNSYGRPWDSREKAIYGGAEFISERYVNDGQNTLYFQKFNTSPTSSAPLYTGQYMTNLLGHVVESENNYYTYRDLNLLDGGYVFDIPVYLNMPEVVSLPTNASEINTLDSISINGKNLETFDKDIEEYIVPISYEEKEAKIEVVKTDKKSETLGPGIYTLDKEETLITIKVVSESGKTRNYKITIKKVQDMTTISEILEKLSVKTTNEVMHGIIPLSTSVGDIKKAVLNLSPNASVFIMDEENKGVEETSFLKTGYKIKITAPSTEVKEFTISIKGDLSKDGELSILDLLKIQKYLLNESTLTPAQLISADVNEDGEVSLLDLLRLQKVLMGESQI